MPTGGESKWEGYEGADSIFRGVSEDYFLRDDVWVDVVYRELFLFEEEEDEVVPEGEGLTRESVFFFFFFLSFPFLLLLHKKTHSPPQIFDDCSILSSILLDKNPQCHETMAKKEWKRSLLHSCRLYKSDFRELFRKRSKILEIMHNVAPFSPNNTSPFLSSFPPSSSFSSFSEDQRNQQQQQPTKQQQQIQQQPQQPQQQQQQLPAVVKLSIRSYFPLLKAMKSAVGVDYSSLCSETLEILLDVFESLPEQVCLFVFFVSFFFCFVFLSLFSFFLMFSHPLSRRFKMQKTV